jgi:hypothetical protein
MPTGKRRSTARKSASRTTARKKTTGRKTARAKRGKRAVALPVEILNDVRDAVKSATGRKALTSAAEDRLEEIFEQTVGRFRRRVRAETRDADIWQNRDFKAYILKVARKIGRDAAKTNRAEISVHDFNASAVEVMLAENRACAVRVADGHVEVDPPSALHGPVCSEFLADQS